MSSYLHDALISTLQVTVYFIMFIGLLQIFIYFIQLIIALYVFFDNPHKERKIQSIQKNDGMLHPITIIMPAYNESITIIESIKSILASDYPNADVIVVNDGSTDDTFELINQFFNLERTLHNLNTNNPNLLSHAKIKGVYISRKDSRLRVIDKVNGGKADAHNAAINLSRSPIICLLDADSILAPDALTNAMVPFIDDPKTIAVGGTVRVANSCLIKNGLVKKINLSQKYIVLLQIIEYMRSFLMAKVAWNHISALPIISGAFGLFRRDFAIRIGGFSVGSVGEDYDFTVKLHKYIYDSKVDYKIKYVPTAICWTQVPEKWRVLQNQRIRWHIGALQTFFHFQNLIFNIKYSRVSFLILPFSILTDIIGPLSELLGYVLLPLFWYLQIVNGNIILSYFLLVICYNIFISSVAISIDGLLLKGLDKVKYLMSLFLISFLENFGYRQICLYWKIRGFLRLKKGKITWGKMERVKFDK
ncbi:glycosyltransferase family 2 protein [Gilliamella sp. B2776]|uniref:glycosyltransferase family 2 protein n=1 Tax=unclassified Gilliamella TaxID=2685620 RepID=UPI00226A478E|nr:MULTISPECIES: glycosyltransferase family 2 protein [unclassified Gilliamella]MCX8650713.1 glycosyltransferase family 2 protein [Gilliamella sp. B2779]MCX8654330.1 glycosyltransferase family 2 protein [Gilliamella sp. B2737]MCX8657087.1 glycosyltransferase family 2 protein [Gilliamella sp. B2894]MCX8665811.1 glycosyltransferase family 2 protein [Gilliamella sp. B2887]MCX8692561.1 glycosyltransferase family 2 protein [Gilliamella sp. B2776]